MDIIMHEDAWERMWAYTELHNKEIAAFGYVEPRDGDLYVSELFPVPQFATATEVDFFTQGLPYAVAKAQEDGKLEQLRFCFHSHVNMPTGYSSTDEDCIEKIRKASPFLPWFVSCITNKKGDTNGRLDMFGPGMNLPGLAHVKGITLDVYREGSEREDDQYINEIEQFVKERPKAMIPSTTKKGAKKSVDVPDEAFSCAGMDLTSLSEEQLEKEIEQAVENERKAHDQKWVSADDTDGWRYYFDDDGTFMCAGLNLSIFTGDGE